MVESHEWVPSERLPMVYDNITDAFVSIVFAKIPSSALPTHGILIRLMSTIPDLQVSTLTVWPDWAIFERFLAKVVQMFGNFLGYFETWHFK